MTMSIREKYEDFVRKYNCEPDYASVIIQWKDSGMFGAMGAATIKLSSGLDEYDDEIFYYADGLSDLEALTEKDNGEDFYILEEYTEFLKSLD